MVECRLRRCFRTGSKPQLIFSPVGKLLPMKDRYFKNIEIGENGESRGRMITESDIITYSGITGNYHPLHTDKVTIDSSRFDGPVVPRMLVLSIATSLKTNGGKCMNENRYSRVLSCEIVDAENEVYQNDVIEVEWKVTEKKRQGEYGVVTSDCKVIRGDDELIFDFILREAVLYEAEW